MGKQKRMVAQSFGGGDYSIVRTTVNKYPKCFFETEEKDKHKAIVIKQEAPILIDIPLLCDGRGRNVIPANLYIRSKARFSPDEKTLKDYAQALLAFYRYMSIDGFNIYDVGSEKENGVVYKFRDFLLENVKREVDGELQGIYAPSTASSYVLKVVDFYNFLNASKIVEFSDSFVPFEYKTKSIQKRNSARRNNRKLGHLERGMDKIVVKTTELTKPFGKKQAVAPHKKLTPMTEDYKAIFIEALGDDFSEPKNLMLKLAVESGLRLEEFTTFPESEVQDPQAEIVKCTIGEVRNGCRTKFDKERTIEVPYETMNELNQYRLSVARNNARNKSLVPHNCLFVKSDGYPYSTNTLEKHFEEIRLKIRKKHPDWYYTVHDLRATFATHWLYNKHLETGMLFDALMEDLKELMGHADTSTTEKYVKYMNTQENWFKFARLQNKLASKHLNS
ncbi:tyrosine-type recombinase/integrase [Photobacterium leiognathi]|uniref:tyrosine-type recombinase/integrase n=1 Tax=Photobacterium leiognathi TaxID=553611 RepID=UPI00273A3700|nr:site-specific integrase [Photobacterium leiognathi]